MKFFIHGQNLKVAQRIIASGTARILTADFRFSPEWDGMRKYAHFEQGEKKYPVLIENDKITADKNLNLGQGVWEVWVHGNRFDDDANFQRITTVKAKISVDPSGLCGDPLPVEPPSFGEQLDERVSALEAGGGAGGGGGTADHSKLINREQPDQHPMSAITGLTDALDGKQPSGDYAMADDIPTKLSELESDATHQTVSEEEKNAWNAAGLTIDDVAAEIDKRSDYAAVVSKGYVGDKNAYDTQLMDALGLYPAVAKTTVGSVNVMPIESESGYWAGSIGEKPTSVEAPYMRRTPAAFDVTAIPVSGGYRHMWLSSEGVTKATAKVLCLDSAGTIAYVSNTSIFPKEIYAPENTTACLFYVASTANEISQYCLSDAEEYSPYTDGKGRIYIRADAIDPEFSPGKPLTGKTVAFIGDSIFGAVRGDTSVSSYAANVSGATAVNCGFSGCKLASGGAYQAYQEAFAMGKLADAIASGDWAMQEAQISSAPEYFRGQLDNIKSIDWASTYGAVIHFGTNDFSTSTRLDNPENRTDGKTICGALRHSLETIMAKYPALRIFISLPCYRVWPGDPTEYAESKTVNGIKLPEVGAALAGVAREYHIPVVDGYHAIGANRYTWEAYLDDGLHHTPLGRKALGSYIGQCLSSGDSAGAPGKDGTPGGHYTPSVSQPSPDTMRIEFAGSLPDMPPVDPATVNLPKGTGKLEPLTFTGAVSATYDGTEAVSVEIPTVQDVIDALPKWKGGSF